MRVYTEKGFDAAAPENYSWWVFVEPVEVKCAAFILINEIKSCDRETELYGLRQGLCALAKVGTVEMGDWGKQ